MSSMDPNKAKHNVPRCPQRSDDPPLLRARRDSVRYQCFPQCRAVYRRRRRLCSRHHLEREAVSGVQSNGRRNVPFEMRYSRT